VSSAGRTERCPHVNEVPTFDSSPLEYNHGKGLRPQFRAFHLALQPRWDVDHYCSSFLSCISGAGYRVAYSVKVSPYKQKMNANLEGLFSRTLDTAFLGTKSNAT
jgi:hypothetical protein